MQMEAKRGRFGRANEDLWQTGLWRNRSPLRRPRFPRGPAATRPLPLLIVSADLLLVQLEKHAAIGRIDRDGHLVANHAGNRAPVIAQASRARVSLATQRKARVGR